MKQTYFVILLSIFLMACVEGKVFDETKRIPEATWSQYEPLYFGVEVEDTTAFYDFYIHLRHAGNYPFRNLYVFSRIERPDGKQAVDTLQFQLADAQGNWLGKGIGDIYDYRYVYKTDVPLEKSGLYTFKFEQAMREESLPGVTDFGLMLIKRQ